MFQDGSPLGRAIYGLAKATALAGGIALLGLVVLVVVSVFGRAFIWAGLRPVYGDYELVEKGVGFAIFAFLPWAHLTRSHALVTLITDRFGDAVNRVILVITDVMMLAASSFIAWRLYYGMLDKFAYGETTLMLRIPLGWGYMAGFAGALVFAIVSVYVLGRSLSAAIRGENEPSAQGAHL
ncbi:TRAP transporter small permease [Pelagibacterium limicola]|uniref:TRAP transporter small permease n=1 Tax=Pelagibacterium limicola TaxID=2791022 RepID=UPI0018AFE0D5|nr:TRAP transporter small permease [Pelagibacterium limicola]